MDFDTVSFQDFKRKNDLSTDEALRVLVDKIEELR